MPITYKNRRGQVWTLFEGKTKTGKPRFFLSQASTAENAESAAKIPEGYEVYEKPSGQVFYRKKLPVLITDDEVRLVGAELSRRKLGFCIVERKGEDLIIHEPQGVNLGEDFLRAYGATGDHVRREMAKMPPKHYQPILRFKLMDDEERLFSAFRWCFKGSIDDWYPIDYEKPLADLAKKYVKHIGQKSFYELF